jgi:hypothetical protein
VRTVSEAHELSGGRLRVGIPEEVPKILARRRNYDEVGDTCDCSHAIEKCIAAYNKSRSSRAFEDLPQCTCRERWVESLREEEDGDAPSIGERARSVLSRLSP